jgi:hypothetical protein
VLLAGRNLFAAIGLLVLHGRKSRNALTFRSGFGLYFHELFFRIFLLELIPSRFVGLTVWATNHIE